MRSNQTRTLISSADTWVAITVPVGAADILLGVESSSATFRISVDNNLNPASEGLYVGATGLYGHEGVTTAELTIYISASLSTFAILTYN